MQEIQVCNYLVVELLKDVEIFLANKAALLHKISRIRGYVESAKAKETDPANRKFMDDILVEISAGESKVRAP